MIGFIIISAFSLSLCVAKEYVPGEPGAEWSPEEVNVMRQRVLAWFHVSKGVTEMQLFRLSFHDCVTYKDGTGGCDGKISDYFITLKNK